MGARTKGQPAEDPLAKLVAAARDVRSTPYAGQANDQAQKPFKRK